MGLDIEFIDGDTRESVLYLQNPETFFDRLLVENPELVEEPNSDFWVDDVDLEMSASALTSEGAKFPDSLANLPSMREIEQSHNVLMATELKDLSDLDMSLLIMEALLAYVRANGRLICAWSA